MTKEKQSINESITIVFTISRVFDAPRDLLFDAWTKPA
jgi:uncharacterized protein YndB with AHSA1/START domain